MPTGKSQISEAERPNWPWAVRLPAHSTGVDEQTRVALGQLRKTPEVFVLNEPAWIWLRGSSLNEQTSSLLRALPDADRYLVLPDDQLARWGESIPRARLPAGQWHPISKWLSITLPTASFTPQVQACIPFQLVRSSVPVEANLLRTTWTTWRDYATTAPQVRLNQLSFAASESEALIRGIPIPPVPGQRFIEAGGVAIPLGWRPEPELNAKSIRHLLQVPEGTMALLLEDGSFESIPDHVFVRATRSATRMTDAVGDKISEATS